MAEDADPQKMLLIAIRLAVAARAETSALIVALRERNALSLAEETEILRLGRERSDIVLRELSEELGVDVRKARKKPGRSH